jgi:hypothetical protein
MLGLSLDAWNNIMVLFLGIGAVAGVIVVASNFVVIRLQKLEAIDAQAAFEQYKLGVEGRVADAKREGVEAGKTAGNALVRAAELEKEAADARLETEKIKRAVAWRTISSADALTLGNTLATKPGSVNLRYMDGDPEALFFAYQFAQILIKNHWRVASGSFKPSNAIIFGINLPDGDSEDAKKLRSAFSSAKLSFSTALLPRAGIGFSVETIEGAPSLMIGSRIPAIP